MIGHYKYALRFIARYSRSQTQIPLHCKNKYYIITTIRYEKGIVSTKKDKKIASKHLLAQIKSQQEELARLQEQVLFYRKMIAMLPGNVYWKDANGYFLGCNNNVAKICGYQSPDEIIGKSNQDFFSSDIVKLADQVDYEVIHYHKEKSVEEIGPSLEHPRATYLSKKIPLVDDSGRVIGLLGAAFDITERKKMEEDLKIAKEKAEASNRAKTQFLAVVNHELRTPLTSIVGLVDFLKQGKLSKNEEKNIVDAIDDCTQHLLNLVNDVLDFSRLETGKYNIRYEHVNLNAILYEVYGITKTLARKKGLELCIQSGGNIPKNIITDARILRQILINLVSNGIKFTDEGAITIQLNSLMQKENWIHLEISVIDTGYGIPTDKLNLIFEPFQQLEDAYTRQSSRSGTGLGLAIVNKLASLIGSKVHVCSEAGKGSSFSLRGKFEIPEADLHSLNGPQILVIEKLKKKRKRKPICKSKVFPYLLTKRPRVLLIEDDPIVQFVHKKMLDDLGCVVDAFTHGEEAIKHLQGHDLLFVDISLPDISGFDVIKKIRDTFTKPIPIIALTVYTGKEERLACLKAGANEFASKPISQNNLKKILLRYLQVPLKQSEHFSEIHPLL